MAIEILKVQLNLDNASDKELFDHYKKLEIAYPDATGASIVRMLLRLHLELSKVYGLRFDWQQLTKPPPYVSQILDAVRNIKVAGGKARVMVEDESDGQVIEFGEGLFDE